MSFYSSLSATAQELLERYGSLITFIQQTSTVTDPNKPWRPTIGEETLQAVGVLTDYQLLETLRSNILQGDQKLLVSPLSVDGANLSSYNFVEIDGRRWQVVGVEVVKPGPVVLLYEVQVRT